MDEELYFRDGVRGDAKVAIARRYFTQLTLVYTKGGELHRAGGPAVEHANGTRRWFENGELHRIGGPAIEYANGSRYWYKNNKLYSEVRRKRVLTDMRSGGKAARC